MPEENAITILLIEDDTGDAEYFRELLEGHPEAVFHIRWAKSIREARAIAAEGGIDIIVTDLGLPDSTGLDTFHNIYGFAGSIPVLLLTGNADDQIGVAAVKEGAQDYLLKDDLNTKTLVRTIRYAIERNHLSLANQELLNIMAHELRTPIGVIKEGNLQLAEGLHGNVNESQKHILTMAITNIERLVRLINDILDKAKFDLGKVKLNKKDFDLAELIHEVVDGFSARARIKSIEIVDTVTKAIIVKADRDKIAQVYVNLIGNAIKFTERGSITISAVNRDDGVECGVSDTGRGIASEDAKKVFLKYEQFGKNPAEKGTGLGLSIAKSIVELHGGRIWFDSEPGKGSSFKFIIPKDT